MTDLRKRIAYSVLVLTAVYLSHTLAYLIAHPDSMQRYVALAGHGYLDLFGAIVVPASVVAVGAMAVRHARAIGGQPVTLSRLAAVQTLAFVTLEVVERIPAGSALGVAGEPAVAVGVLLQLPFAYLFLRLIGTAAEVIRRVDARRTPSIPVAETRPRPAWPVITSRIPVSTAGNFSVGWRGPPRVVCTH